MRCLIIQKGVVVNIAEVTPETASANGWPEAGVAQIGWRWINNTAVPPERDIAAEWAEVRKQRDHLLETTVDRINPIRWSALSPEQQEQWRQYRQALLDLPASAADPKDIRVPALADFAAAAPKQEEVKIEAAVTPAPKPGKRKRAHEEDGTFKADDPATSDVNEAFES